MSSRLCTNCRVSRSSSFRKPPASLAGPQQLHGQSPFADPPCSGVKARLLPLHPAPSGAVPASRALSITASPAGSWLSLSFFICSPRGAILSEERCWKSSTRLIALAASEDPGRPVPVLAVNEHYLQSTLSSPCVLEQHHDGQIQPPVRSVGSRKPFPPALMGAGPSPEALMTWIYSKHCH